MNAASTADRHAPGSGVPANGVPANGVPASRSGRRIRRVRKRIARSMIWGMIASTAVAPLGGCGLLGKIPPGPHDTTASYHDNHGLQIEYPDVAQCATPQSLNAQQTLTPYSLEDPSTLPALDMSLEQAVNLAVQQSPVLRSIGGSIVTAPVSARTIYEPALTAASPTLGTEAALAAFDAQYTQQLFWANTNQPQNFPGDTFGQPTVVEGTGATFNGALSKTTASGASFALRHVVNYNRDNRFEGIRLFNSTFQGWVEAEWRQPLLQGAGTTYNRIAGPTTVPGQYNGVLIARVNEDVALADFESSVIQLVSDVEQAYWDLVTAYRVLDANVKGREAALQTFQFQQVRLEVGSGRSDEEAQARSQYYQFQAQVESSLGGATGLYALEQRLRYLIGMAATDGRLIRPTTEPTDARVVFDWESALGQSLERRVEIRRQKFGVKRREMELIAAKLNLRPRLDFLAQYRWRGLGNHLIGDSNPGTLDNLYSEITGGDFQEGQAGIEMNFPVGFRAASTAIAHAKLSLKREQSVLAETELRISHDLSEAGRQIALTYQLVETNYNRFRADLHQVDVLRRRYRDGNDNINFLLQAQRQVVTSATDFYRALSAYNLAIRDFHQQKGSLLAYNHVQLAEGPWAAGAAYDACQVGRFLQPRHDPAAVCGPAPLTSGPFDPSAVQGETVVSDPPGAIEMHPEASSAVGDMQQLPASALEPLRDEGLIESAVN